MPLEIEQKPVAEMTEDELWDFVDAMVELKGKAPSAYEKAMAEREQAEPGCREPLEKQIAFKQSMDREFEKLKRSALWELHRPERESRQMIQGVLHDFKASDQPN